MKAGIESSPIVPMVERLAQYRAGLAVGELRITRCRECGTNEFPPRAACACCGAPGPAEWITSSGRGRVWSFVVFHKRYLSDPAPRPPYNVAVVQLVEGPKLITNIVGIADSDIRVDMPVEAVFDRHGDTVVVRFRPSTPAGPTADTPASEQNPSR
jgi:Predicted nucleic-acid-binding protein containing a Zn-ribbon